MTIDPAQLAGDAGIHPRGVRLGTAVAPGDHASRRSQRQAVLEAAAHLADLRDGERAKDVVGQKLEKEWTTDHRLGLVCGGLVALVLLLSAVNDGLRLVLGVDKTWRCSVKASARHCVEESKGMSLVALEYLQPPKQRVLLAQWLLCRHVDGLFLIKR